jgi:ketosteroid isomerase-like protein
VEAWREDDITPCAPFRYHRRDMTDGEALDDLRRRLEVAENAGDADFIVGVMAEDAVIMVPDFEVQEGREASARFIREVLTGLHEHFRRRISYVSAEIAVRGDVAFDRGTFAFTATPRSGGDTTFANGKYLWMYSRGPQGGWQLSRLVASLDEDRGPGQAAPSPLRRALGAIAGIVRRIVADARR